MSDFHSLVSTIPMLPCVCVYTSELLSPITLSVLFVVEVKFSSLQESLSTGTKIEDFVFQVWNDLFVSTPFNRIIER